MSIGLNGQISDPLQELAARADAGQKLGMLAIEFVMGLAHASGRTLDFYGAASAIESNPNVDALDPESAAIEKRSRAIVAQLLRTFAQAQQARTPR